MQHDTPAVLDGVRVLDVGRYLAGPYCASLLAKFGAEVVRVEPVAGGDDRQLVPLGHGLAGALFLQANQGKRGMTLELGAEAGRAILRRLVERSDVVVANLRRPQHCASWASTIRACARWRRTSSCHG